MGKIVLILGGARSGKSTFALSLAKKCKKVGFIATCQALDKEMEDRISRHREVRPASWRTFEETRGVASMLSKMGNGFDCIIIDCLTLLISNLILSGNNDNEILKEMADVMNNLRTKKAKTIIVSNEVGLGIVPKNKLARNFRDIAGKVNQLVANAADEVFFSVSGIPTKIK
jgi:adenosylcobinamide kinase/adenosylcobinamide-phosphate guanylyltransferase